MVETCHSGLGPTETRKEGSKSGTFQEGAMRLPRMTTRRWMRVVVGAAVVMWMATVAYRVQVDPQSRYIHHLWGERKDSPEGLRRSITSTLCHAPFWPLYWRRLLGQPWPGTYRCRCDDPRYAINGAVSQFYTLIGSRPGSSDSVEPINALLREYSQAHRTLEEKITPW